MTSTIASEQAVDTSESAADHPPHRLGRLQLGLYRLPDPGSDRKENYAFVGPGVSQNPNQYVNLTETARLQPGAAGMPNGISNNLHLHFTAEVFINLGGEFRLRWGVDGKQGEYIAKDGDIISVPTWIFRGFTNEGPDEGLLFTVLGRDAPAASSGARRCSGGRVLRPAPDRGQPADRHRRRRRASGRRGRSSSRCSSVH